MTLQASQKLKSSPALNKLRKQLTDLFFPFDDWKAGSRPFYSRIFPLFLSPAQRHRFTCVRKTSRDPWISRVDTEVGTPSEKPWMVTTIQRVCTPPPTALCSQETGKPSGRWAGKGASITYTTEEICIKMHALFKCPSLSVTLSVCLCAGESTQNSEMLWEVRSQQ